MKKMMRLPALVAMVAVAGLLAFAKEEVYKVDEKLSKVHWVGKKTTGQHEGDVPFKSGSIKISNGVPVSGDFVLNVDAITCTDITDPEDNKGLVEHLKNDDFFSTAKYPTATLTIKKFETLTNSPAGANYTATADLTIKDVKREIQFPARVDVDADGVKAHAPITIDRTKWNVNYKSKTVFGSLGDKFIYDDVSFEVKLVLKK